MRVLVTEPIHPKGIAVLETVAEVVQGNSKDPARIAESIRGCDAVLVRSARITADIMDASPGLRCIAKHGVGLDAIDVEAATARGIRVVNAPDSNANAVAEHTLALMLALLRDTAPLNAATRSGPYEAVRKAVLLTELTGKTVGFVGFGKIARRVREFLVPFRTRCLALDAYADDAVFRNADIARCKTLQDLLGQCDLVSIHAPLTPETRNLFNAESLAWMKKGSFLLNAARGGIVNEADLVAALGAGHLAGAASDVFSTEPPAADNALLGNAKVLLSPHCAALTREALENMAVHAAQGIAAVLRNEPWSAIVNATALEI